MRPTKFRRSTPCATLPQRAIHQMRFPYALTCFLLLAGLADAQSQPRNAIVRPSQGQAISGVQQPADSSSLRAPSPNETLPNEAWTNQAWTGQNNSLPPLPSSPPRNSSNSRAVVPAAYNASANAAQEVGAAKPPAPEKRVALTPRSKSSTTDAPATGSRNTLQMLLSVGSSLLIVVGLFLGVAWFYRKTLSSPLGGLPKQVVSVLGRTPIAPRQQLMLVRFGSKLVLVSLVQGEMRSISEITDPLEVDQLAGLCESSQPGSISASFRSILNQGGSAA